MTLDELIEIKRKADEEYTEARYAMHAVIAQKLELAQAEIEQSFAAEKEAVEELARKLEDARRAVEQEKIRLAMSGEDRLIPIGTRVCRKDYTVYYGLKTKLIYGIVEVRTPETEFPKNRASWSIPDVGDRFVRLCKSDGTPGKKIECFGTNWKPCPEEAKS